VRARNMHGADVDAVGRAKGGLVRIRHVATRYS
jgi:hypothetical protein